MDYNAQNTEMFSNEDLCVFVQDTLERKYKVQITAIELSLGIFTFSVLTSRPEEMAIPFFWNPIRFGVDAITFRMSLEDFTKNCSRLEERDFESTFKQYFQRIHGNVAEIISLDKPTEPLEEDSLELVIRLKPNATFKNSPYMPILWVKGDLIAVEADGIVLGDMIEYLDERRAWKKLLG